MFVTDFRLAPLEIGCIVVTVHHRTRFRMKVRNVLACSVLLAAPVSAQTTIETLSFWDGASEVTPFGKPNTATYGQTFTVPASDNVLQSFSFFLRDLGSGGDLQFEGYVAKWDPSLLQLTGPVLFESAIRSGPTGTGFNRYDFDVGGISLTTGDQYMVFLSSSGFFGSIPGTTSQAGWGILPTDVDGNIGAFMFSNNGDDFATLFTPAWSAFNRDLAFEVVLGQPEPSVVPEPSTVLLMGTGMAILVLGVARRKRRS